MKFIDLIFVVMFSGFSAHAQNSAPLELMIGGVKVKVVLGNIVDQNTEALALSHWPDGVNDGGGVGGAIANAGGQSSLDQLQEILIGSGGRLNYTTVYPTQVATGGRIKAHTLLNVIELAPAKQLYFTTLSELENSPIPLLPADVIAYRSLLEKYGPAIQVYEAAVQEAKARLEEGVSDENLRHLISTYSRGTGATFENERRSLVKKYEKQIGFETVAVSMQNVLAKAAELNIKSVSLATMGYGIMGDLSIRESLAAMLTGVSAFVLPPESALEVRVVIYAQDSPQGRNWVFSNLLPVVEDGQFLKMAKANGVGQHRDVDWVAARNSFLKNDLPTLVVTEPSTLMRVKSFCGDLLRKPFNYFRGY